MHKKRKKDYIQNILKEAKQVFASHKGPIQNNKLL